ncbi:VOC family protein [Herbaspirillum sp. YR522]|uniref:VOC family protein n=1 Tax=Herbaspirillum sp. YR522 TaxID=1144342 RepID=UPI00026F9964|nr:VOC family protein [Herbaspirillum sp. YR522]EJN09864.1 hypothetical protein PMI40_00409 [Herbaspirillum sp. YR522]
MTERVDHVVIHVEDQLDQAAEQYAKLGFTLTARGHHSKGTSNHLAIFGDDYLELLGVEPRNAGLRWGHPAGLAGLVFKTPDADQTWQRLRQRDVPLEGEAPQAFHRPVEVDGVALGDARFRTLRIAADRIPNGRVFFCEHGTPELVWRSQWQNHPNGARGLAEYVYLALDPDAACGILAQAFGRGDISRHAQGVRFQAGPVAIRYLTRDGVAAHYGIDPDQVPQGIERAVGLTIKVESLDLAEQVLAANAVTGARRHGDKLVVTPDQANGVILAFT